MTLQVLHPDHTPLPAHISSHIYPIDDIHRQTESMYFMPRIPERVLDQHTILTTKASPLASSSSQTELLGDGSRFWTPFSSRDDVASIGTQLSALYASPAPTQEENIYQDGRDVDDDNPVKLRGKGNPKNWSSRKKFASMAIVSWLNFVTALASSMLAPGLPHVARDLEITSKPLASFVLSIYMIGLAFAPLIAAPLSETYGRLAVFQITTLCFCAFTIACGFAKSTSAFLILRLLAGLLGSGALSVASGLGNDILHRHERAKFMAIGAAVVLLAPCIGPTVGGKVIEARSWRWIFYIVGAIGGVNIALVSIFVRETHVPTLIRRRNRKVKKTGDVRVISNITKPQDTDNRLRRGLLVPAKLLCFSPLVILLSTFNAAVYGVLYVLFTSIPFVFGPRYGFSTKETGLVYLAPGAGMMLGLVFCGRIGDRVVKKKRQLTAEEDLQLLTIQGEAHYIAEDRLTLWLTLPGAGFLVSGLIIYAWTTENDIHVVAPLAGLVTFGCGLIMATVPTSIYLIDCFPLHAASALAAVSFLRSILAAVLPLSALDMYSALGSGWASTLLACTSAVATSIVFICRAYGSVLRRRTTIDS